MWLHLLITLGVGAFAAVCVTLTITDTIMAKAQEVIAQIQALGTTLDRIAEDVTTLKSEIDDLKEAAANGDVPQEVTDAIERVAQRAQLIDDQVTNPTDGTKG